MSTTPNNADGENPILSGELQRFAAELARLRPRDDRLDRERLAFLAGQASVAPALLKSVKTLGLPLESHAWAAAFAAMTAIAATLLCMLLTRPEMPGVPSIATDTRVQSEPQTSIDRIGDRGVLTTRDVHSTDIETRLAKIDADRIGDGTSASPKDDLTHPVFTPTAWQQVIHETESAKPLPRKSSSLSTYQGINT